MSLKSILRAVGSFLSGRMGDDAANGMERLAADLERDRIGRRAVARLKGRRDWSGGPDASAQPAWLDVITKVDPWAKLRGCAACNWTGYADFAAVPCEACQGHGMPPGTVRNTPGKGFSQGPDPWPETDDPYAKPEPCTVVSDPALSTIKDYASRTNENSRRLAERGLSGRPMDSVKSVTDLLQLIERQEAAERELIHRGMEWDPVTRRWIDPDTKP